MQTGKNAQNKPLINIIPLQSESSIHIDAIPHLERFFVVQTLDKNAASQEKAINININVNTKFTTSSESILSTGFYAYTILTKNGVQWSELKALMLGNDILEHDKAKIAGVTASFAIVGAGIGAGIANIPGVMDGMGGMEVAYSSLCIGVGLLVAAGAFLILYNTDFGLRVTDYAKEQYSYRPC